jgi:hypothetical protein
MGYVLCEVNDSFKILDEYRFGAAFQKLNDLSQYQSVTDDFRLIMQRITTGKVPQPAEVFFKGRLETRAACTGENLRGYKRYVESDPQEHWDKFFPDPRPGLANKIRYLLVDGRNKRRYDSPETHKGFFAILRMVRNSIEHSSMLLLSEY